MQALREPDKLWHVSSIIIQGSPTWALRLEATSRIEGFYFIVQSSCWIIYSPLKEYLHMTNRLNSLTDQLCNLVLWETLTRSFSCFFFNLVFKEILNKYVLEIFNLTFEFNVILESWKALLIVMWSEKIRLCPRDKIKKQQENQKQTRLTNTR